MPGPAAATIIVLLTGASGTGAPSFIDESAMLTAAREALGTETQLETVPVSHAPDDDAAFAFATAHNAMAVVRLMSDANARSVTLRFYRPASGANVAPFDHILHFGESDQPPEIGRAVGYAMAAILGFHARSKPKPPDPPALSAPAIRRSTVEIDLAAQGLLGMTETTHELGFMARLSLPFATRYHAGANVGWMRGEHPAADAVSERLTLGVGGARTLWRAEWVETRPRIELGVSRLGVTHSSDDDIRPDTRTRWLPWAFLGAEIGAPVGRDFAVLAEMGLGYFFGRTDLFVDGQKTASVAALYSVARLGIRAQF